MIFRYFSSPKNVFIGAELDKCKSQIHALAFSTHFQLESEGN